MKILFIYAALLEDEPFKYLDRKMNPAEFYVPKAGLYTLIAALRREYPDFTYKALDILNPSHRAMPEEELEQWILDTMSEAELRDEVSAFDPDIVGISCLSTHAEALPRIIEVIKETKKDVTVLVGGSFATTSPRQAVLTEHVDFIAHGEGDITICRLVDALLNGGDFHDIRGIGFLQGNEIVLTPAHPFIDDLDSLPFPAWDLCNFENYSRVHRYLGSGVFHTAKTNYGNIVSSRGCPYGCTYCHKIYGSKFRARSARNVVEEMVYLHDEFDVEEFTFSDDVFNFDRERVAEICKLLINADRGIKFGFMTNGLRGDRLSPELIDLMVDAGMRVAAIAVESASPRIQREMKKNLDLEKSRRNIDYMSQKGVYTATYNMLGFQTETREEIKETLNFNLQLPHHVLIALTVTPHEGTELYNEVAGDGEVPPGAKYGRLFWKPDAVDDSFREVSSTFIKIMLIRFITEFYFSKKRFDLNLEIMTRNQDNPHFIAGLKTFYRNMWDTYSKAIPKSKKKELEPLLNKLLDFQSQDSREREVA
jgi:radical SAM superfamily enzyme YgiQ (UPF0313 family)